MSDLPRIAQKQPFPIEVEAGKTYFWCACGLSKNQPFCDGSHQTTDLSPTKYEAEKTGKVFFCGCKQSGRGALCDGTHNTL